jgi:hypothetical protein
VKKPVKGMPRPVSAEKYKVIAESNGHKWMEFAGMICCKECGVVRRFDDANNPCKGLVNIELRFGHVGRQDLTHR